jgi:hypothetical protein
MNQRLKKSKTRKYETIRRKQVKLFKVIFFWGGGADMTPKSTGDNNKNRQMGLQQI